MPGNAVLTRDGPVSVPMDYTVPSSGELLPLTVRASIDGSGTAVAFYAVVQVLAPSGRVMGSYITTSIAAGASADVTWFPGLNTASAAATASGAWTQVFHYDVPALGAPTSIDTVGSTWSNSTNNIFGMFMGQSATASHNEELWLTVNNDALSHYGYGYMFGNMYISGTPGVFGSGGNVLDTHGALGLIGGVGDTLGFTSIFFQIPQIYQSSESGKISATGGYAGLVSGVQQVAITSYEFAAISRLKLVTQSGAAFQPGTSLTLWSV